MHSIKQTMYPGDKIGEVITHRQHFPFGGNLPMTNLFSKHLPAPNESDPNYWDTYIYFSQISQAMATKVESETYRFLLFHT